ncbi:MAG: dTDP-glucose 4,6-dehydratase [Acidobacteria bacterium]|nr:dTDP-glucose 4,6-dehydratase [Acidobacteriota bacterium]
MRLLITGGAGFIGSNFVRYLLKSRPEVSIINLDALTYAGNLESLDDLPHDRHKFVRGDISQRDQVEACADGVDAIINLAAESHVDRSILDSSAFIRTNVVGTQVLLETMRRRKIARFLQVSTDEVYGSIETGKFTEMSPLYTNSPYAASKASADLLARSYHRTYGLDIVITRCSNNFGPYQFPEKLIPLMILNALEDARLPVYGDGLYVRDWIHVEDHCRALEMVLFRGSPGEIYNVGSNQEMTNREVIQRVLDILGKPASLIQNVTDRPGHDRRYALDSTKIRHDFGWTPLIPFDQGLENTVRWYLEHQAWTAHVRSGSYRHYYEQMYERRSQTLANL